MWTFSDLCAMVYVVEIGVIPNFQENKQGAFAPDIYLGGKTMDTKILEKYGITGTTEIVYNPTYEQLFEA